MTIDITEEERKVLLSLAWKLNIYQEPITSYKAFEYQGCASEGYCFNCKVIVGDPTCFCLGGICPLCKNQVASRNLPKDLNGEVLKYYHYNRFFDKTNVDKPISKLLFKDGKYERTLENYAKD